ncbi:MAG TPA: hypothetical protein VHI75_01720 [Casimicrobiaceae bacterium]|nr:hypothetical protein [Casimicrobiaceae bacterium]
MTPRIYNAALVAGLLFIGAGVALISVPWALVTVGSLVILLTLFASIMTRK